MKNQSKATPYFSAYPLTAITEQTKDINLQPYLEALLAGQSREAGRAKILSMTTAAPLVEEAAPVHYSHSRLVSAEPSGNDWFRDYE